jgi:ribosome-binding protein aMBF1 (putative translation factor)
MQCVRACAKTLMQVCKDCKQDGWDKRKEGSEEKKSIEVDRHISKIRHTHTNLSKQERMNRLNGHDKWTYIHIERTNKWTVFCEWLYGINE